MTDTRALVTGAGGFIGHHLVDYLTALGYRVRGVDLKHPEFAGTRADEFIIADLRDPRDAESVMQGVSHVYALAADMGGMGYISAHDAEIFHANSLINLNTIEAARRGQVDRYLFSSSACVYPQTHQTSTVATGLKETDAFPADPQDGYGWEKLMSELACKYYYSDHQLETRVVRFHNVFGPLGTWSGGREKAPAAICRKVAMAKLSGSGVVEIWGDGEQTRSFCYVDDCVAGLYRLMQSDYREPLNLGQDRLISINEMARLVASIAEIEIELVHVDGPQGVRGRNSDNTRLREVLGWQPAVSLETGLRATYEWIEERVRIEVESEIQAPADASSLARSR